jgi:hypothetical protein
MMQGNVEEMKEVAGKKYQTFINKKFLKSLKGQENNIKKFF